ncbi:MAG: hypothetical protein KBD21_01415 [Candidatus Pacebacteria bacterium]|nr:hypothetical protein [Candidatus Paceibacterota bacterium]
MNRIHTGRIKMRPRWFFILGSLTTFVGLVMAILASIFALSFVQLSLRGSGELAEHEMDALLSHFSWWGPIIALTSLVLGIWLLRKYEFSYKKNFVTIAIGFVFAVIVASFILDLTGLNEVMLQGIQFKSPSPTEFTLYKQAEHFEPHTL